MIIAITGYIGAGKTTTAGIFRQHGYKVIDVDSLGHELLKNPSVRERMRGEFGLAILGRNLEIDRKKLSKVVFGDDTKLNRLNRVIHPYLKSEIKREIAKLGDNIVIDVALYQELEVDRYAQKVILIQSDVSNVYERLNHLYSKREIITIMNNQNIIRKPDYIIENNGTIEDLKRRVGQIIDKLDIHK